MGVRQANEIEFLKELLKMKPVIFRQFMIAENLDHTDGGDCR